MTAAIPISLAHPGGAIKTNKAAALAKFLERKLQEPHGLESMDPDLIELAVENAKRAVKSALNTYIMSTVRHKPLDRQDEHWLESRRIVMHVDSFDDPQPSFSEKLKKKKSKGKKKLKQKNKRKVEGEIGCYTGNKKKKKLKL